MDKNDKVPIIIGYAEPFRLIVRDEDVWDPSILEVNYHHAEHGGFFSRTSSADHLYLLFVAL